MTAFDTENKLGISADLLMQSAPYGILVLDDALKICGANAAACRILNVEDVNAATGRPVSDFLDPEVFRRVMDSGEAVQEASVHLSRDRYVERSIAYDRGSGRLLCFMRDITAE
ncbi:MAG: PAS domain-containing protein, partial [Clostridia bacterium]|nr:PAS domain-containing protein [Clostridia bacterium]